MRDRKPLYDHEGLKWLDAWRKAYPQEGNPSLAGLVRNAYEEHLDKLWEIIRAQEELIGLMGDDIQQMSGIYFSRSFTANVTGQARCDRAEQLRGIIRGLKADVDEADTSPASARERDTKGERSEVPATQEPNGTPE